MVSAPCAPFRNQVIQDIVLTRDPGAPVAMLCFITRATGRSSSGCRIPQTCRAKRRAPRGLVLAVKHAKEATNVGL